MESFKKKRMQQLEKEKEIDEKLAKAHPKCPDHVYMYLMHMRKLNRDNSERIYKASFFSIPNEMEFAYDTVEKIQQKFYSDITAQFLCEKSLPDIISDS